MALNLNDLMREVAEQGARLVVKKDRLGIDGDVPDRLRAQIIEHRTELTRYLTYDQETAYALLRDARAYIAERFVVGAELDTEDFDERIAQAELAEDMWALRTAVREWVLAWIQAISRTREAA